MQERKEHQSSDDERDSSDAEPLLEVEKKRKREPSVNEMADDEDDHDSGIGETELDLNSTIVSSLLSAGEEQVLQALIPVDSDSASDLDSKKRRDKHEKRRRK